MQKSVRLKRGAYGDVGDLDSRGGALRNGLSGFENNRPNSSEAIEVEKSVLLREREKKLEEPRDRDRRRDVPETENKRSSHLCSNKCKACSKVRRREAGSGES